MKSIFESVLLYAIVKKLQELDDRSVEILKCYIYTFWLGKIDDHDVAKPFTANEAWDFWKLTLATLRESGSWSSQHRIVTQKLLELFKEVSWDSIQRLIAVTSVTIDWSRAEKDLDRANGQIKHNIGSMMSSTEFFQIK